MVLSVNPNSAAAYTTLGVIYHLDGKISEAIVKYHQALAIVPDDSVTLEMLEQALGMKSSSSASSTEESGILTSSSSSTPTTDPTAGLNINTLVSPKRKQKQTKDLMHLSAADNSIETLISSLPVEFHQVSASAIANGGVSSSTSGSPAVASGGGGVGGTSSFDDDRFIPEKLRAVMKANQDALNSHLIGDEDEEEAADDDEEGNDLREQGEEDDGEEMELEDADEDGGDATINNSLLLTRLRSSVRQTPASNTSSSAAAARSSRMDNTPVTAANRAPGVNDHQNPPPRRSGRTLHLAQESTDDDAEEQEMDLDSD